MKDIKEIEHNLEVAKPLFLAFITNMNPSLARWIQYRGFEIKGSGLVFNFKSSQNSLSFSCFAGVAMPDMETKLFVFNELIYEYFKALKYENIK
jgi:hypothetical protein